VYQQLTVDVSQWPKIGDLIAVAYSPKNPDRWTFAPPETPGEHPAA
jgi:hypothetical protein